ncbi:MAG: Ig-like domain-containing protein [Myxococcota bacterium]
MRTTRLWVILASLVACNGGDKDTGTDTDTTVTDGDADADADSDTDTDTDLDCYATIAAVDPEPDARLVPVDQVVTVTFSEAIAPSQPWSLEVVPATGTATLAADGLSASWTGSLEPDTEYTINAAVCEATGTTSFYTIAPPVDPADLLGKTYSVVWDDMQVDQPGNGAAVKLLIQIDYILAQILDIDTTTMVADSIGTVGVDDGYGGIYPDCNVAVNQTADFSQNPYFSITGDIDIIVNGAGDTATVEDFELLARVSPDGTELSQIHISGAIATETVIADADCYSPTVQVLNPTCVPCTTSDTGLCMLFEAQATLAEEVPLDLGATCAL